MSFLECNISMNERCFRICSGLSLIVLTMLWSKLGVPPYLSIIGAYLTLTAIPAWDPLYAAAGVVLSKMKIGSIKYTTPHLVK